MPEQEGVWPVNALLRVNALLCYCATGVSFRRPDQQNQGQ